MWRISQTIAVVATIFLAAVWVYYAQIDLKERSILSERQALSEQRTGPDLLLLSEKEWKERLSPEEFHILREKGTEPAYSGKYWNHEEEGIYRCAACDLPLFSSKAKYKSGTGWPSFWEPVNLLHVDFADDYALLTKRIEVLCGRCRSHLGHVFEDGPPPTGLRYCINSLALKFEKKPQ